MRSTVKNLVCLLFVVSIVKCQTKLNETDDNNDALIEDYDYFNDYNLITASDDNSSTIYTDPLEKSDSQANQDWNNSSYDDVDNKPNTTIQADVVAKNETKVEKITAVTENENNPTPIHEDITLDHQKVQVIQSPGYPNGYSNNCVWTWNISAGIGYGLEINVTDVDLNMAESDHLVLNPGDGPGDKNSLLFSGYLKKPRNYRILDFDTISITFVSNYKTNNNEMHRGFNISVRHIGLLTTTEASTLPTPEWIRTPEENHTVFLSGMQPRHFINVSESFRMILVDMVYYYIDNVSLDMNTTTGHNITVEDRVKLEIVKSCNINWPNADTCIVVIYSVPLFFNETTGYYQMTRENMILMWNSLVDTDYYRGMLAAIDLSVYHMPNDDAVLTWWMVISLGVILVMLVLAYVIWKLNCFDEYTRMSRLSETESHVSKKISDSSLYPTPHQTIPPLFGMESYDNEWMDQSMPPNYNYNMGQQEENKPNAASNVGYNNRSFIHDDNLFFELDSDEEIVMSLPDNVSHRESRMPRESTF